VAKDPPCPQTPLSSKHERLAPIHVLPGLNLVFKPGVILLILNSLTLPRRIDDGIVMLVLEACGIPLRFGEVQLSLVALNPKLEVFYVLSDNQLSGPLVDDRSKNLLVFWWEVV
nr:hypothetical protein [Tanacetum cinerariifolium]